MLLKWLRIASFSEAANFSKLIPGDPFLELVLGAADAVDVATGLELKGSEGIIRPHWLIQAQETPRVGSAFAYKTAAERRIIRELALRF